MTPWRACLARVVRRGDRAVVGPIRLHARARSSIKTGEAPIGALCCVRLRSLRGRYVRVAVNARALAAGATAEADHRIESEVYVPGAVGGLSHKLNALVLALCCHGGAVDRSAASPPVATLSVMHARRVGSLTLELRLSLRPVGPSISCKSVMLHLCMRGWRGWGRQLAAHPAQRAVAAQSLV